LVGAFVGDSGNIDGGGSGALSFTLLRISTSGHPRTSSGVRSIRAIGNAIIG
jgi:hypothetical protein